LALKAVASSAPTAPAGFGFSGLKRLMNAWFVKLVDAAYAAMLPASVRPVR
jgi:hypothetical protein